GPAATAARPVVPPAARLAVRPAASATTRLGVGHNASWCRPQPPCTRPCRIRRPGDRRQRHLRANAAGRGPWLDLRPAVGSTVRLSAPLNLGFQLLELGLVLARVVAAEKQLAARGQYGANLRGRSAAVATVEGGQGGAGECRWGH